jgi:hypothetical protein
VEREESLMQMEAYATEAEISMEKMAGLDEGLLAFSLPHSRLYG